LVIIQLKPIVYLILVCIRQCPRAQNNAAYSTPWFLDNLVLKNLLFFLFCVFCSGQILGIFSRPTSHCASNWREQYRKIG